MRRSTHWLVADEGIRPAGKPDRCFYCDIPQGQEHKSGCVIRNRTVVVRFHVDLVIPVPEDWDSDMVQFHYNDSSWCADNLATTLSETVERLDEQGGCMCRCVEAEFVREATDEDESAQHLRANELPS